MTTFIFFQKEAYRVSKFFKLKNTYKTVQIGIRFGSSFVPNRVLLLTKVSRYQLEKLSNPNLSEDNLKKKLLDRGINYEAILAGHHRNKDTESKTIQTLQHLNIPYRIRNRYSIDIRSIAWADLVLPVGGDGTFLLASNLINSNKKRIVGINSDPEFSEGFLLLPPKYTSNIKEIFEKLRSGNFKCLMRSRIRTTLTGENIWQKPFHMHENNSSNENERFYETHHESSKPKGNLPKTRKLPWLALNEVKFSIEVFIGESLSARISILHINIGNDVFHKVKSSGMCVATGTGSSSWYKAINALSPQVVEDVLRVAECKTIPTNEEMKQICFKFNSGLQYPAEQLKLSYAIRDMIVKHIWPLPKSMHHRGFCEKLTVQSQCYDGGLVIDGGIAVHFNVGTTAKLETLEEDALCNIVFDD